MKSSVVTIVATHKGFAAWGLGLVITGLLFFVLGGTLAWSWFTAEMPQKKVVSLYITPLTQVIPGYSFKSGYPSVTVSMSDFRSQSAGKPFVLFYSKKWETGESMGEYSERAVSYMMKMKDSDMYLVTYQYAPLLVRRYTRWPQPSTRKIRPSSRWLPASPTSPFSGA